MDRPARVLQASIMKPWQEARIAKGVTKEQGAALEAARRGFHPASGGPECQNAMTECILAGWIDPKTLYITDVGRVALAAVKT